MSLIDGQRNFDKFGATELRLVSHVRKPEAGDKRDSEWHPIDESTDNTEKSVRGMEYGGTYPEDRTALYYWRQNYWRR